MFLNEALYNKSLICESYIQYNAVFKILNCRKFNIYIICTDDEDINPRNKFPIWLNMFISYTEYIEI